MSETLKQIVHKDINIDVVWNHGQVKFEINDKKFDGRVTYFDSLDKAKDAIDNYVQAKARIVANKVAIKRQVLDANGSPMTVIGINRNDGSTKVRDYVHPTYYGSTAKDNTYSGDAYPNRPWIKEILTELKALRERERELHKKLGRTKIGLHRYGSYGRRVEIDIYERLVKEMDDKIQAAEDEASAIEAARAVAALKQKENV